MAGKRSYITAERDAKALGMKQRGLSLAQICEALGYRSKSTAHDAIKRALQDCYREERGQAEQLELERLDDVLRILYREMHASHVKVSSTGKVVTGDDGRPVRDGTPVIQAALGIVRVSESRRKLLGIDAPARTRVTVITDQDLEAAADKLEAEITDLLAQEAASAAADADSGVA